MVSIKKNGILENDGEFPYSNSSNKVRIIKILSHYLNIKNHQDKDQFHFFLKDKLEKIQNENREQTL
ncbi:hypothetical protein MACJ_003992 [Theileria orientalis]|uniref:Uncharacterized protein n=1 Tax=Theileria orientalis TaxID=68886 RepID=A0A976SKQ8_THEOR|nr:hypothetical protein MACJ_003992 [Theileria orientalis]